MHRIAPQAGGWTADTEGVIIIDQNPAPIVLLTMADTDIQTLAQLSTIYRIIFPQFAPSIYPSYNSNTVSITMGTRYYPKQE